MDSQLILYTLISLGASLALTPILRNLALKFGMVDEPNERKIHPKAVPYGGGIAIFLAFLIVFLLVGNFQPEYRGFLIGAVIVLLAGIYDDYKGMHAMPKLFFQCLAAIAAISFGLQFDMSMLLKGNLEQFYFLSIPLTFGWIIGIINAINLIDGLDGLAGGVSMIAALTLAAVSFLTGDMTVAFLALGLGAAILGFLPYNLRSKIFMGDAGSMFLGYSLATLSIIGSAKLATAFSVLVPITILLIPIFDTLFAIFRRLLRHKPIFAGDRQHFHHRLLDLGLSPLQTVSVIYFFSIILAVLAIYSSQVRARTGYLLFGTSLLVLFGFTSVVVYLHQKKTNHI
jgi:UDP-GlcNAc:undecaprenyl-phosphate GlcNAc-1-phosphate transferase